VIDSRPFGVALIGYGLAGECFHAPLIRYTDGLEVRAVVTANPTRQATARSAFPHAAVLEDAQSLLSQPDGVDVVVVATPNRSHVDLALAGLDAGLAVVVDKPLATSAEDARRLVTYALRTDGKLTVFQNRRWDADFLTLQALVAEGALGELWRLESRFERWVPTPKSGWRENPDPAEGGGVLLDLGAHLIDQALLILGPAAGVYGELDKRRDGAAVVDDAFVAITHASGARSHLSMSSATGRPAARFRALGALGGFTTAGMDRQEGQLRAGLTPADAGFGVIPESEWGTLGAGTDVRPVRMVPGQYPAFYAGLVEALRGDAPLPVDPFQALEALEVMEAAQRSSTTGKVVVPDSL
jgi:scyllo-inositol 2-dehydrogenase (NADP+)